jgi:hypothetical protein
MPSQRYEQLEIWVGRAFGKLRFAKQSFTKRSLCYLLLVLRFQLSCFLMMGYFLPAILTIPHYYE